MGGETAVRALVERFYDLMDSLPEAGDIRSLHAKSLKGSRQKLFMFLSGWLGGPPLYEETHGHPRLRARHLPFPIGIRERDQWMYCMKKALYHIDIEDKLREELMAAFWKTADHMRNKPEHDSGVMPTIVAGKKQS
jgi:hemoglobin